MSALTSINRNLSIPETDKLNAYDQKAFEIAEENVRSGFAAYITAVKSLKTIKEHKWYRSIGYTSFEVYVSEQFNISRNYADYLVKSADVLDNIIAYFGGKSHRGGTFSDEKNLAIGDALPISLPTSERVTRPLSQLPDAEQGPAWEGIVEEAKQAGVPVTSPRVQAEVNKRTGKTTPQTSVHHTAPNTPNTQRSAAPNPENATGNRFAFGACTAPPFPKLQPFSGYTK